MNLDAERFLRLLEHAPLAIAVQEGPELTYRFANVVYRAYLGGRDVVGLPRRAVLPDEARLSSLLQWVLDSGKPYVNGELSLRVNRSGAGFTEERALSINLDPILEDGRAVGVLTVATDVTDQVVARRQAQALAADLELAVHARDDFLAMASHELRTPLTALGLRLERALRIHGAQPDEAEEELRHALRSTRSLAALVDELLDVSRISAGRMRLEPRPLDLVALVRDVVERLRPQAERAGCAVDLRSEAEQIFGEWDRGRIDQVVSNLLSNAFKYGKGRPVTVELGGGDPARLAVIDRGIGIHADAHARIFERFERTAPTGYGGLGLGLWIVREIVVAHGGAISVSSAPGQGATFTVRLPRAPAASQPDGQGGGPPA